MIRLENWLCIRIILDQLADLLQQPVMILIQNRCFCVGFSVPESNGIIIAYQRIELTVIGSAFNSFDLFFHVSFSFRVSGHFKISFWGECYRHRKTGAEGLCALRMVCYVCEVNHPVTYLQSRRAMCDDHNGLIRHTPEILEQMLFRISIECRGCFIQEQYRAI